jgi:biotin carboxyl carrier protein
MPGLVVRIPVAEGQKIAAGASLLVLEAMKMENELRASGEGTVKTIRVRAGQAVEKGEVLIEFADP